MFLIFDTETTGLPRNYNAPVSDSSNWPRMVQIAWQLHAVDGKLLHAGNFIVKPDNYTIPFNATQIHGISTERAIAEGHDLNHVLQELNSVLARTTYVVGHNIEFDLKIVGAEFFRQKMETALTAIKSIDTKLSATEYCALPGGKGGQFKWPTLLELHAKLFGYRFEDAHDAAYDVAATAKCFFGLVKENVVRIQEITDSQTVSYEPPVLGYANFKHKSDAEAVRETTLKQSAENQQIDSPFVHLHNHTQFSVLQATTEISALVKKAVGEKMPAVAMTDLGNMMGAFAFVKEVLGNNKKAKAKNDELVKEGYPPTEIEIKPIVGCELSVCKNHADKTQKDNGYPVVLLAKNKNGYHNLAKLSSIAHVSGFYYIPRIDREVLLQYKTDLIALSGGLTGEIADLILNVGEAQAEEAVLWWKEQFGDDYYLELNRHGLPENDHVNHILIEFGKRHGVKCVATNNAYYLNKSDSNAHDILLCVKESTQKSMPIGRGRGFRFGFPNDEFYFKSQDEMKQLFADLPETIEVIKEVVDKVEIYDLSRSVLLPKFEIPEEFRDPADSEDGGKRGENAYLRHLTYAGAATRYPDMTDEVRGRIDFELETIAKTGYPGYFLIVQDFTTKSREMGVWVGPGRGSAAGSVVAYCTGITNVDPVKYDLLFERFLNPDRVSLPDIDIDFDDEGRSKVIDYVVGKYGSSQVAQIITYGSMAARSAIRDTARVLELKLEDAGRLANLIPGDLSLKQLLSMPEDKLRAKLQGEELPAALELRKLANGTDLAADTIRQAGILEGSLRNTGVHACGVIITPDDITKFIPVAAAKDSDLQVTQFDNSVVESAGLLKMDFLGLKTLTLIKDAMRIIKGTRGIELNPDDLPLDDVKTYELFQRGETVGVFQFESPGMQKHLRALKPDKFGDLIAMNALYRPGPLEYIPNFIKRKNGEEPITYDLPEMQEYLEETYGITVYQEQVMLLSQKLANFSKGDADVLRKAMGKKQREVLDKMKDKFISGAIQNGLNVQVLEKVWKDWEAFAQYAFNKSHSTCYALLAYQSAFLKANYPAEYMASVLSNNLTDIKAITFFMEECKRMGVKVLNPDVNESFHKFSVNKDGHIRAGLGGVKGVGEGAVNSIIEERKNNGPFASIFDLARRIDLRAANKRTMESLALAGAFDCFPAHNRAQYFFVGPGDTLTGLEKVLRYGMNHQESKSSAQVSLFGDQESVNLPEPILAPCEDWGSITRLRKEKEMVGMYLSGHPLDDFEFEIKNFCRNTTVDLQNLAPLKGKEVTFAGVSTKVEERMTKNGQPFGKMFLEDYEGTAEIVMFGDDYARFRNYFVPGWFLFIKGKVTERFRDSGMLELKVSKIEPLAGLRDILAESLSLRVPLHRLTPQMIEELSTHFNSNGGNCKVKFEVYESQESMEVSLPARTLRVKLTNELLRMLGENEIRYKVNA